MKKKLLLAFFVMMLSVIALGVVNASAATYGDLTYVVSEGEVTITDCSTSASKVVIPGKLGGYPVTAINFYAFYGCSKLTSVTIGDSVTTIGSGAFSDCSSLTSITIPDSVTTIDGDAFYNCSSLTSITIPDSVIEIGNNAFYNTGYYNNTENWEKDVLYIGNYLIEAKTTLSGSYAIKEGTRIIGTSAFESCSSLTSVTIPDSVTAIGTSAFESCRKLTSVTIPDSVTTIGEYAFYKCSRLTSITIPDGVIAISVGVFRECSSLTSVTIGDSVTTIGNYAFYNCDSLTSITISDSVTTIGMYAFYNTGYYNNTENWENEVLYIGNYLIEAKTTLSGSYTIKEGTKAIGGGAFLGCSSLISIDVSSDNEKFSSLDGNLYNKDKTTLIQYAIGKSDTYFKIPDSVTTIGDFAFYYCGSLTSVTIGDSVTTIGNYAFYNCSSLTTVYYNGSQKKWDEIAIDSNNKNLTNATKKFFLYVTLLDEDENQIGEKTYDAGSCIDLSDIEKTGYTAHLYVDNEFTNEYAINTPINENLTLYLKYIPNQYTYKFVDEDGNVIKRETVDYGTTIELPSYTPKANTQQYTYTFLGWEGYTDGMVLTDDVTFKAKYTVAINQYTYKFVDEDGTIIKEETADYGTAIIPPEIADKTEYYLFDYWTGYSEGIILTDNISFTAVYKYKNYSITAEGLADIVTVTYNSNYVVEAQSKDGYTFAGYFTEKGGKGTKITNEKGESLDVYNVVGDLKVYPYFESVYMNKLKLQGATSAMPGGTITQSAIFATDKDAMYLVATIKYPKHLSFKSIKGVDFKEATKDSEKVVGDFKYADITCVFDYEGNFAEINTNYVPFEIEFDVNTDATLGACEISIENVMLIGDDTYEISDIKNHTLTILPKLAESIEIIGSAKIDKATQFTTIVSPDYTTDKSVVWSVDDESVATITEDGTVTPVKNGTVVITATAKDGSEVFATKTINVIAYAKISSLDFGSGVALPEFNPDVRQYTVYVEGDVTSISLTPTFSGGGVLRPNGSGVWVSGRAKEFELTGEKTIITLNRENVTGMTNSVYTIEVIRLKETEIDVSADGKSFTIIPVNVETGKTVVLALYNCEKFVEMHSAVYAGEAIPFTTDRAYTDAKVMVWDDLTTLKPICDVEELN